jgi:hypothetical protein
MNSTPETSQQPTQMSRDEALRVLQKCHAGDIDDFLSEIRQKKTTDEPSTTMSNTPETDGHLRRNTGNGSEWVKADFARKLERERDQWRKCAEERKQAWYELQSAFERSRDEVNALERERDLARGAMAAQDMREMAAGDKCGVPYHKHGCDWPDAAAEQLLATRRELQLLLESTKVETCSEPLPERDGEPADFSGAITRMRLAEAERDQWRECAELFANSLCRPNGDNPTAKAFLRTIKKWEEAE